MRQTYTGNEALDSLIYVHKTSLKELERAITSYRARGHQAFDDIGLMLNGFGERGIRSFKSQLEGNIGLYKPSDAPFIGLMTQELGMAYKRFLETFEKRENKYFSDWSENRRKYSDAIALALENSETVRTYANVPLNAPAVEFPGAAAALKSLFDSLPEHPEVRVAQANLEASIQIAKF